MVDSIKGFIKWLIISTVVIAVVKVMYISIRVAVDGCYNFNFADDMITLLLILSILLNIVLIDTIVRVVKRSVSDSSSFKILSSTEYQVLSTASSWTWKDVSEYINMISQVSASCKVMDKIICDTIKNELGENSETIKFTSIKSFAEYLKSINDHQMEYLENFKTDKKIK